MLTIRKMNMSDSSFIANAESKVLGTRVDKKTIINESLYNKMAHYYIAIEDNVRVGYIGFWITEPNAEILNLFVDEKYRSKKIGKSLVEAMINCCKEMNVGSITLEVRPSNLPARKVYEGLGFNVIAKRKQYYKDNEDAYLMEKKLGV